MNNPDVIEQALCDKEFKYSIIGAIIGGVLMSLAWIAFGVMYSLGVWLGLLFVTAFTGIIVVDMCEVEPGAFGWAIMVSIGCSPFYAFAPTIVALFVIDIICRIQGIPFPDSPFGLLMK